MSISQTDVGSTKEVNNTLMALIPMVDCPEKVTQFRPILLCNVVYKCMMKIIVQRMKGIMERIVSPYQVSFVPGRNIHDTIIIVNEMVHSMRWKKGKKGFMAIKVVLEKACDRISWKSMERILTELNCPSQMVERIMGCVTTITNRLLWHGEK